MSHSLLTADDDNFHSPTDDWWFHETCWYWFYIPERGIGAWLYNWIRPAIGVSGGGCWLWDDTTHVHWEVPYYANYNNLRLPDERDLRNFRFPSGVGVKMIEPLHRYELTYSDRDQIDLNLEFTSVMEPWVSLRADDSGVDRPYHLDQVGRVRGDLFLHGEAMTVDCLAIRDRTWGLRSERWKTGGGYGYTNAAAESGEAFLAVDSGSMKGYLTLDGNTAAIRGGIRRVERDSITGAPSEVAIEATDVEGRLLQARGEIVSRMAMPIPGVHAVVWTSLMRWTINDVPAWGEDQEPWPIAEWSNRRRSIANG